MIKHCRISFYFLHFLSQGEVIKRAATWIIGTMKTFLLTINTHPWMRKKTLFTISLQSLKLTRCYQAKTFTITLSTASWRIYPNQGRVLCFHLAKLLFRQLFISKVAREVILLPPEKLRQTLSCLSQNTFQCLSPRNIHYNADPTHTNVEASNCLKNYPRRPILESN